MKTMKILITLAAFLLAGLTFNACEKNDMKPDRGNSPWGQAESEFVVADVVYEEYDCALDCIDLTVPEEDRVYFKIGASKTGSAGINHKKVSYVAYNTESHFVVKVTYEITAGPSNAKADITVTVDGGDLEFEEEVQKFEKVEKNNTVVALFLLPAGWKACDPVEFTILQEALGDITFDGTYYLVGVCTGECETTFSAETECEDVIIDGVTYNRKAVYTFTTESEGEFKIQGGLTNFIGQDYLVQASVGDVESWIPGQSSNRIISVEGILGDCGEVEIVIYWFSENTDEIITGDWTVELDGLKILEIEGMECDDEKEGLPVE